LRCLVFHILQQTLLLHERLHSQSQFAQENRVA
jgi:hypothetical protein